MALRQQRQQMKHRHENQDDITDFLYPLLTAQILKMFVGVKQKQFKTLPVNFPGGHAEYLQKWKYLFFYETFNIMVNSRRSNAKEEEFAV